MNSNCAPESNQFWRSQGYFWLFKRPIKRPGKVFDHSAIIFQRNKINIEMNCEKNEKFPLETWVEYMRTYFLVEAINEWVGSLLSLNLKVAGFYLHVHCLYSVNQICLSHANVQHGLLKPVCSQPRSLQSRNKAFIISMCPKTPKSMLTSLSWVEYQVNDTRSLIQTYWRWSC